MCRVGLSLWGMGFGITPHTPFSLPIPNILCQTSRMRNLTATLCLTIAVLLGSVGVSFSETFSYRCVDINNFQKNFIIDTFKKTIIHRSSFNPETNKKFGADDAATIIDWKYDQFQLVWFIVKYDKITKPNYFYTLYQADFSKNILLQTRLDSSQPSLEIQSLRSRCYKD
jgi:hypothetical protein